MDQLDQTSHADDVLPPASLVICSRNRPQLLGDTVDSVLRGNEVPSELIIVDQSDTPNALLATLTTDRDCTIRYLWSRTTGASRGRNAGIRAALHDIIVFTDDDVLVTPTWLAALTRALLRAGPRAVVTGKVVPSTEDTPGTFVPSLKADESPAIYTGRIGQDVLFAGNMAMSRAAVTEVGVFDERLGPGTPFPGGEDNDLGFRLLEAGYSINYAPQAALYHRAWRSEREYLRLRWRYGLGQGGFFAKHLSRHDRYMLHRLYGAAADHLRGAAYSLWHDPRHAYGNLAYTAGLLYGVGRWLVMQRTPH